MADDMKKHVVIIGAGPAGLTAAYKLAQDNNYRVTVIEKESFVGGIARTVNHNGNRIDIGGHRFFSKSTEVMDLWQEIMPVQGKPAADDIILGREKPLNPGGPDPEKEENVLLIRSRVSRILYLKKFFDYPISLKMQTITNMGLTKTIAAGVVYVKSQAFKRKEETLEDFMINRFGTALYRMFFKDYTAKVWGRDPSEISAEWGAQRIKGLSLTKAVVYMLKKPFIRKGLNQDNVETSLIDLFSYPKKGPGQLWEEMAAEVQKRGGNIIFSAKVSAINATGGSIKSVTIQTDAGVNELKADCFISSMPISELISELNCEVPAEIKDTAINLPYRDFITVGLLINKLRIKNTTKLKTIAGVVPDCWIYVQEPSVKMGRVQIFNNWSPYMVKDFQNTVWIGLEYFCSEGDEMWNMPDADFIKFAVNEAVETGLIEAGSVLDSVRINVEKAYPAYFGTYENFDIVKEYLNGFQNLYCIGRNGQHRYNNMDHSMLTAIEAVNAIKAGGTGKADIWNVNAESEYHETRSSAEKGSQNG
jgi:protoporphyrinogen oxidase